MKKRNLTLLVCLLIAALLTGCGAAVNESADALYDYEYKMETTSAAMGTAPETALSDGMTSASDIGDYSNPDAKLVKTVWMDAQTKDYDTLIPSIEEKITALGGYIENRDAYNGSSFYGSDVRNCSMTIRIPADNLSDFVGHVSDNANVTNSSESVENITLQYVDTAAQVEALEVEQSRLLELLEQAENLTEILEIESRLSDVRYELSSYASQLRVMDNQVSYATVHLDISEVEKLTPVEEPGVWDRISEGFGETMDRIGTGAVDLLVWISVNSPWFLLLGALTVVIVLICKAASRKSPKKPASPPENQQ